MITTDTIPSDDHDINYSILKAVLERAAAVPVAGQATLYIAICTDPRIFALQEERLATLEIQAAGNPYKLTMWVSRGAILVTFHRKELEFNPAHTRFLELANPNSIDTVFAIVDHYLTKPLT